jgi:Phosphodiester glycosidase
MYKKDVNSSGWQWPDRCVIQLLALSLLLVLPLLLYNLPYFYRPARQPETRSLFPGMNYERQILSQPRPVVLHIVTIDLTTPGLRVLVTPGQAQANHETTARTVSEFLTEFKLQLAINANFFYEFHEDTPWDYYPRTGDRVNNVGQVISNGNVYSKAEKNWAVICFAANHQAQILASGTCPAGTQQAVAGNEMLLVDGQLTTRIAKLAVTAHDKPYARTAVALDKTGKKLWLILADGKQRLYSEGLKTVELATLVQQLGAYQALNLDGGGSVTLAIATSTGAQVLNAPFQTKVPLRERPVANHLGFYTQ